MDKQFDGLKKIYAKLNAENAEDLICRNHALYELGQLYLEKCDFPNALDCLEKVKTEALQFHLYDNYFKSVRFLLRIHAERLDFEKHDSLMREALQVGESLVNFKRYLAKLYYNQGIAAVLKQDKEKALRFFQQGEAAAKEMLADTTLNKRDREDMQRDLLSARYGQAVVTKEQKKYSEALEMLEVLLKEIDELHHGGEALETLHLYDLEASAFILKGTCHRYLGEYSKSLEFYWKAHAILKAYRNWSTYYYVLLGLGTTYMAMGNAERAQIFFDLITDAISNLELNALKQTIEKISTGVRNNRLSLQIDRERKVVIEKQLGEVHFERRFVLLEILYLLASQPGRVFTKEELVDKIWRESYNPMIHDSKVYTSISRLRKLVEPDFKRPIYILNERDGYSFNPLVQLEEINSRFRASPSVGVKEPVLRIDNDGRSVQEGVRL